MPWGSLHHTRHCHSRPQGSHQANKPLSNCQKLKVQSQSSRKFHSIKRSMDFSCTQIQTLPQWQSSRRTTSTSTITRQSPSTRTAEVSVCSRACQTWCLHTSKPTLWRPRIVVSTRLCSTRSDKGKVYSLHLWKWPPTPRPRSRKLTCLARVLSAQHSMEAPEPVSKQLRPQLDAWTTWTRHHHSRASKEANQPVGMTSAHIWESSRPQMQWHFSLLSRLKSQRTSSKRSRWWAHTPRVSRRAQCRGCMRRSTTWSPLPRGTLRTETTSTVPPVSWQNWLNHRLNSRLSLNASKSWNLYLRNCSNLCKCWRPWWRKTCKSSSTRSP